MIPNFDVNPPEERGPMCSGCESRGPSEDLDSDGLCAECREQTHVALGGKTWKGPTRRSCDCVTCWVHFRSVDAEAEMDREARLREDAYWRHINNKIDAARGK